MPLGAGAPAWDEFSPVLHRLTRHSRGGRRPATRARSASACGRSRTQGTQFVVNGRKTFLRGTLECAIFPKTGHPPTDVASWQRIVRIAKAHGLNTIRFHSWCPPEAAFTAADEEGFYYQVEVGVVGEQLDPPRRRPADRRVALPRDGPHPEGLRQPPVVRAPALRQRARRARRGVPRPLGRALEGAGPAPALHERLGLAADPREPVPRRPRPAHPGLGRGARVARQREAAGDADRLPRLRAARERCP